MLIVYIFECASCITSYTHRDYVSQAGEGAGAGQNGAEPGWARDDAGSGYGGGEDISRVAGPIGDRPLP